ncbi:MAG: ATP synthase F1 subunit epsilon [Opitutales bacterium]|nr:ATP synthase F1 subunit epsilon [Opitutales bacterium]
MALLLEIVTPEKKVYCETVDSVVLPTSSGQIDVLPGHIPLMTLLEAGELMVTRNGTTDALAVDRGFAQVQGDKISVLTEAAINIQEIDAGAAEDARRRAEEALAQAEARKEDPEILEELETKARFAIVQQLAKERKR